MSSFVIVTAKTREPTERRRRRSAPSSSRPGRPATSRKSRIANSAGTPRTPGSWSSPTAAVPDEALLGPLGKGARVFLTALDGGRVGIAAMSVGLAQGALEQATAYAKERMAFGAPIARQQADLHQAGRPADPDRGRAPADLPRRGVERSGQTLHLEAAAAKLFASELAVRAAEENMQIHGGFGYIEESAVPRFYRDAKILTIGEGTSEICRYVIARQMGLVD